MKTKLLIYVSLFIGIYLSIIIGYEIGKNSVKVIIENGWAKPMAQIKCDNHKLWLFLSEDQSTTTMRVYCFPSDKSHIWQVINN